MPLGGLKIDVGGSSRGDDGEDVDMPSVRGKPGSLLEYAQAKLGQLDTAEPLDMTMQDKYDSFMVSDDGTLKMLSSSGTKYSINGGGLRKNTTPDSIAESPGGPFGGTNSPVTPGTDKYYRCRQTEIRKIKDSPLGKGASGSVYKAVNRPTGEIVALKEIDALDKGNRDQMLTEVRTLCELPDTEGLVKFFGAFYTAEDGRISIALEYMNAGSLEDCSAMMPNGKVPESILSMVCGKILTGLKYLHDVKRLVHRDIKPANLLINLEGEPKITDFGISASLSNTHDFMNTYVGTMQYMSPERLHNLPYSFSSDIWAIGLTFLQLAVGRYPYTSSAPVPLILEISDQDIPVPEPSAEISEEFVDFISMCMEKDPDDRPSAEALLASKWIQKHKAAANSELKAFVRRMHPDADQRIEKDKQAALQFSLVNR
mmetsp:Transcript_12784/g.26973  ORF Transcript_12784/g.26973 Transcript_12784/m.26973 type:complete len:428 (-) Transcript_12784:57-1340(-)|eukprot:CAMPEP_0118933260 /NCGR_PEP_ID=MMETSP1169-20130426/11851_1 /TAXON_ID=36882 /ORGANISM="Pyramimonas obovata, Strain CCMP722" /LENGTH=427 /DNA_ID=CAMNT_0006875999 /DNA_START=161 /DNA_END=1444 /DNA_ORIENTATION=+